MKILVLNYEYPPIGGGGGPVSRDLATELQRMGHTVTVITMRYGSFLNETFEDGVRVIRVDCFRKSKSACSPVEQLSYIVSALKLIKKSVELQKYDICHAHFVIPTGWLAYSIKRKYGIRYVLTAHGSDVEGHNTKLSMRVMHRMIRPFWRRIVKQSYKVVSPSIHLKQLMYSNFRIDKYSYISNGIDYELYASLKNRRKTHTILVMGRLQKFKNVQTILYALKDINLGDWNVQILGDGPYALPLKELSEQLELIEKVKFLGWIDNKTQEQLDIISSASIYISASKFENCPMSVAETVVAGCYPILSDIPAHRQLISGGGSFFDPNDTNELTCVLQNAINQIDNGIEMNIPNMSEYSWGKISKRYEELLIEASTCKG